MKKQELSVHNRTTAERHNIVMVEFLNCHVFNHLRYIGNFKSIYKVNIKQEEERAQQRTETWR